MVAVALGTDNGTPDIAAAAADEVQGTVPQQDKTGGFPANIGLHVSSDECELWAPALLQTLRDRTNTDLRLTEKRPSVTPSVLGDSTVVDFAAPQESDNKGTQQCTEERNLVPTRTPPLERRLFQPGALAWTRSLIELGRVPAPVTT